MISQISYTALGLALVAGAPAANAQTVITGAISAPPVETVITQQPAAMIVAQAPVVAAPSATVVTQPAQTVRTVETTRTVRAVPRRMVRHRVVTTTRRITEHVVPTQAAIIPAQTVVTPAVVAPPVAVAPAPTYSQAYYDRPYYDRPYYDDDYNRPLYDTAAPPVPPAPVVGTMPVADQTIVAAPVVGAAVNPAPAYRYVYEPDRILVVDPATNIAVQSLPR